MNRTLLQILMLLVVIIGSIDTARANEVLTTISESKITVGTNYFIHSEHLGQDRQIQVYLPSSYHQSKKTYPVLYVLDGQRWFLHGVTLAQNMNDYEYIPEMIVVGISTDESQRRELLTINKNFVGFIENEVTNFIDGKFRTSSQRILFGWQYTGALVFDALTSQTQVFSGYISASPYPLAGKRIEQVQKFVNDKRDFVHHLFFATQTEEGVVSDGAEELESLLKTKKHENFRWHYERLPPRFKRSAGHRFSSLETLFKGLNAVFTDYQDLEFGSLQQFNESGGLDYFENYYQIRAKKYGLDPKVSFEGIFYLTKLALDAEDYQSLRKFIEHFKHSGYLQQTNESWASLYADLYIEHGDYKGALWLYQIVADHNPQSARPIKKLGDINLAQDKIESAIKHYQRAVEIARINDDKRLEDYQAVLDSIVN